MTERVLDTKERDLLVFGREIDWSKEGLGGTMHFERCPLAVLQKLLANGTLDPDDAQNEAPSSRQFMAFMALHPKLLAHGYVVSPSRDDCRVSIEGLESLEEPTSEEVTEFHSFALGADELQLRPKLYCWWD